MWERITPGWIDFLAVVDLRSALPGEWVEKNLTDG
jgi:hypothetical protein